MKTNHQAALAATIIAVSGIVSTRALAQTNPSVPVGSLSAFPTIVETGTKPTLTWSITYPSVVKNYITVTPPGTLTPKQNLICNIRILGAGVTTQNSNGTINYIETVGLIQYNGSSSWTTIFDGKQTDSVVETQGLLPLFTNKSVTMNKPMNFGGYYIWNGSNGPKFYSTTGTNIRTLVSGDPCPTYLPAYNAPSLETYLKNYLNASNQVCIGPMDVIIFMELTDTDPTAVGYDFQDLVLLVTFSTS